MVLLFCVLGGALGAFAESERGVSPDLKWFITWVGINSRCWCQLLLLLMVVMVLLLSSSVLLALLSSSSLFPYLFLPLASF